MILIRIKGETSRFINKCLKNNINLYKIEYKEDYILARIYENDLDNIKKLNYYSKIEVIKILGIKGLLLNFKRHIVDFILLLFFLLGIFFISNIVVSITIKHENKDLIKEVNEILEKKDIIPFRPSKSLKELQTISEEILEENRDILDWISINKIGMKYFVAFEERILKEEVQKNKTCHIVAKKDGVIKKVTASSGEVVVEDEAFVKKGDILISGDILLKEEVKDSTCANGEVIAETWYKVNVIVPLNYETKEYTGKNRYNFVLNGNYFYKKNYNHFDEVKIAKISNFKIVKQREFILKPQKYTIEEARNIALNKASSKILEKIGKNNKIIAQKVLKESKNNSKIELEIFVSVNESIGKTEYYEVGDTIDTR